MSMQIFAVDAADVLSRSMWPLASRSRLREQLFHRRIEAAALLQLQRQAFGNVARHHAGGLEALHDVQHAQHLRFVAPMLRARSRSTSARM